MTIPRDVRLKIIQDVYAKWQEIFGDQERSRCVVISRPLSFKRVTQSDLELVHSRSLGNYGSED